MITILCGIGHVLSSVLLGFVGIAFGIAVTKLEFLESFRGNLAAWALIAFGLVYFIWGVRRAVKNKPHRHVHSHDGEIMHDHLHFHADEHFHVHEKQSRKNLTPWVLFTIFVLGPCEPLIPLLMYPAAQNNLYGLALVTGIFGAVTILTMLSVVLLVSSGINFFPTTKLERYVHAMAGGIVFLSGISIQFLGL